MANHFISDMLSRPSSPERVTWTGLNQMTLHLVMEEVGEKQKFTQFFFPTFDVIFILLADYGKNPSRGLQKKSSQRLKFQGAGVAPPPLQLWESVWAAAQPSHSARNSPSPACSCIYSWPALVLLPSAHFIIHTYSTVATGNATISASVALLHFTGIGPSYAQTRTNKPGGTGLNVSCIHWIYATCPCGEGPLGRSQKEEAKLARWLDKHSCLSHSKQTNLMFSCQLSQLATTNGLNRDRRYIYDGELRCALV